MKTTDLKTLDLKTLEALRTDAWDREAAAASAVVESRHSYTQAQDWTSAIDAAIAALGRQVFHTDPDLAAAIEAGHVTQKKEI